MVDWTYNTDHGSFLIPAKNNHHVLKALNEELDKTHDGMLCDDVGHALHAFGLDCAYGDGDSVNDIVDIFLADSYFGEVQEKVLTKIIAPFVEAGSFVVFYGGGANGCWGVSWEKNKETDKVEGTVTDGEFVLNSDLEKIIAVARHNDVELYNELVSKYGHPKKEKVDGPGREPAGD